jgi:hypothetical protein
MEEPSAVKMPLIKGRVVAAIPIWILMFSVLALPFGGANQDSPETKIDYTLAQQDILKFELVVNDVINSTFSSSPFAVVQKAKGAYLPGYGISLSLLINIHTAVINTPFGPIQRRAAISPEMKRKRIEELKEKLISVLQDNGDSFRQLRKEDNVTIVAFIEDRNFPDEPSANRTIVLSACKRDLDELGRKPGRMKEFRQRMKIVEY